METKEDKEQKEVTPDEVKFNIGQRQLDLIADLLNKADKDRRDGDRGAWFDDLVGVKLMIISKLGKTVRAELEKTEKTINFISNKFYDEDNLRCNPDAEKTAYNNKLRYILDRHLKEYQSELMLLMDERDYLIPSKEKTTNLFGQSQDDDEDDE